MGLIFPQGKITEYAADIGLCRSNKVEPDIIPYGIYNPYQPTRQYWSCHQTTVYLNLSLHFPLLSYGVLFDQIRSAYGVIKLRTKDSLKNFII